MRGAYTAGKSLEPPLHKSKGEGTLENRDVEGLFNQHSVELTACFEAEK